MKMGLGKAEIEIMGNNARYIQRTMLRDSENGIRYNRYDWDPETSIKRMVPQVSIWYDEETAQENIKNRHFRPTAFYQDVLIHNLQIAFPVLADGSFTWLQNMGCACGCSPGFFAYTSQLIKADFTIDIEEKAMSWIPMREPSAFNSIVPPTDHILSELGLHLMVSNVVLEAV